PSATPPPPPHPPPPPAAAEPALAITRQLHDAEPRHRLCHVPRRIENAVVAPEVARAVKRDRRVQRLRRLDPSLLDQRLDDLRVMENLVCPAELRVLVLNRVEAVRAVRDHLAEAVLLDRLHVLLRDGLVEVLLAEP